MSRIQRRHSVVLPPSPPRARSKHHPLCLLLAFLGAMGLPGCSDSGVSPVEDPDGIPGPPPGNSLAWLTAHTNPIASIESQDFTDLAFLKEAIGDRRIVLLGESGHGVAEFSEMKVRLIQYLHQEMGFDVMAFESSLFECSQADGRAAELSAEELMKDCIYPVWHAEEVLPLFEYLKETRASSNPLLLAGFDMQPSNLRRYENRAEFLPGVVATLDPELAEAVEGWEEEFLTLQGSSYLTGLNNESGDGLYDHYSELHSWFVEHEGDLQASYHEAPGTPLLARQLVWTTLNLIEYARTAWEGRPCGAYEVRDHGMAVNLNFLANELFRDKKIIVWAHNYHIRKANEDTRYWSQYSGYEGHAPGCKTMGSEVADRSQKDGTYTVGFYMLQGSAAWNTREVYAIPAPVAGSLEGYLGFVEEENLFLDLASNVDGTSPNWLTEAIPVRQWGAGYLSMKIRDQYDGILFIRNVRPPTYIN